MKLPNGDRAIIDVKRKLVGYCLNPLHRTGRHKARVFASVLGITAENAMILAEALRVAARESEARIKGRSADAAKFEIECEVTGPAGSGMVRSGWIVERGTDVPRLTSCYVRPRAKGGSRGSRF